MRALRNLAETAFLLCYCIGVGLRGIALPVIVWVGLIQLLIFESGPPR